MFAEMRAKKALSDGLPVKRVLASHLDSVALSMGVTWILTGAVVVVLLLTPSMLKSLYAIDASYANVWAIVCTVFGSIAAGWCADRLGRGDPDPVEPAAGRRLLGDDAQRAAGPEPAAVELLPGRLRRGDRRCGPDHCGEVISGGGAFSRGCRSPITSPTPSSAASPRWWCRP
ncbi:hypothetical protein [Salinicola tamaricis]|uniref:hypothetical protein n=1 Tax=Salinicola tamaricis TaxID=1771309 RepID=UPI001A93A0A9|nr:hypothetical protein [Salinicola tamaricis]